MSEEEIPSFSQLFDETEKKRQLESDIERLLHSLSIKQLEELKDAIERNY